MTDGKRVFSSGGYPRNHLAAIEADGSGTIAWDRDDRVYVPSLLVRDGHLYGVMDAGVAACWNCETGEEVWKRGSAAHLVPHLYFSETKSSPLMKKVLRLSSPLHRKNLND